MYTRCSNTKQRVNRKGKRLEGVDNKCRLLLAAGELLLAYLGTEHGPRAGVSSDRGEGHSRV